MVKNLPAKAGDAGDAGSIPESGSSPGGGHGNPLQYSCLEKLLNREAWGTTVQRVAKSQTRLSMHTHTHTHMKTGSWVSHGGKREGLFTDCAGHINLPIVEIGDDPLGPTEEEMKTERSHNVLQSCGQSAVSRAHAPRGRWQGERRVQRKTPDTRERFRIIP